MFCPYTVWINCSSDLNFFANSWPSASNFRNFSRSLKQFFLKVGQNSFGSKILFFVSYFIAKDHVVDFFFSFCYLRFNIVKRWNILQKMSIIFLLYWKNLPTMSNIFMLVSVKTSFLYPHWCSISFCGLWMYTTPTLLSRNPLINNVTFKINSIIFFKQQ